jgi:putative glycosyl hydrolase-like family 15 (GHL15) protein
MPILLLPSLASANVASQFRVAIGSEASFPDPTVAAQHNSYIVLQAWEGTRAAELKAANPNLKVLVYQNLSAMAQGTSWSGLSSSGVNYAEANTAHPDWFLINKSGGRIAEGGYSWLWMADIGNAGYQQQWTSNVLKLLASGPWDGVMMDDTNTTARYHTNPAEIAQYPNDAAYQSAVRSMLAYAGPRIQAAGKLAVPNIGSWSEYPEVAAEWLQYVSGGIDEMFAKWSTTPGQGYRDASGWRTQIEEIQSAEHMGKLFLAITQAEAGDTQAIRYGWASALLGADGHTAYMAAANYTSESWSSEYEVQLGEPTSTATATAGGVWKRAFTDGLVLVNPTTATVSVDLGGTYSGSGLTRVTSVTMPPNTALILQGAPSEKKISSETGSGTNGEVGASGAGSTGSGSTGASGSGSTGSSSTGPTGSGSTGSGSAGSAGSSSTGSGLTSAEAKIAHAIKVARQHHSGRATVQARLARLPEAAQCRSTTAAGHRRSLNCARAARRAARRHRPSAAARSRER